jgi:hypothetical protein
MQRVAVDRTPQPRKVIINAGAWVPLRHPDHATDQSLQHYTACELISYGDLSQEGSKDGIGGQLGGRQDVVE